MLRWLSELLARILRIFFGAEPEYHYGWIPDSEDARDHKFVPKSEILNNLPKAVDLRSQDGPIFNQGSLGSCTANAWLGVFMFVCMKLFGKQFMGSRLMLYYDSRVAEGNEKQDTGAMVRTGGKILSTIGVCDEAQWPYVVSKFATKPPAECYTAAKDNKAIEYLRIEQKLETLKACLAEGFPIAFGFNVYESFKQTKNGGIMPMPKPGERKTGGHAVEAIGYVDADGTLHSNSLTARLTFRLLRFSGLLRRLTGLRVFPVTPPGNTFIVRNSWGTSWGDAGYFYMPYAFITNASHARDFWTIRQTTTK